MENAEIQSSANSDLHIEKDAALIAKLRRMGRERRAKEFRREYTYGTGKNATEGKTCIWPDTTYSWSEKSSGIMWVGVHGMKSICVVTKAGDLDLTRVQNSLVILTKETVLRHFRRAVISEIEDLADPSSKLRKMVDQNIEAPFGVVSVIPGADKVYKESVYETYGYKEDRLWTLRMRELNIGQTSSDEHENDEYLKNLLEQDKKRQPLFTIPFPAGYDKTKTVMSLLKKMKTDDVTTNGNETIQASSDDYDEKKAIQFLQQKMTKREEAFTVDETIQIAISAFQQLFKNKLTSADEIEVSVMDPDYYLPSKDAHYKDIYVKHLDTSDIEQHLSVINEPGSDGSSSPPRKKSNL